jgi:hypothetical protein
MNLKDWMVNISNAKETQMIKVCKGQKYEAKTPSGHPCLWICVDDEPNEDD